MNNSIQAGLRPLRVLGWALAVFCCAAGTLSASVATDQIFVVRNHATIFEAPRAETGALRILDVLEAPQFGTLTVNPDQTLTFSPQRDVCETQDRFSYTVEREGTLETIEVTVDILCEALTIISNFSPDGDGKNDTFTILGIQNYPGSRLTVFNGAGLEVYAATDYANDWRGTDRDGHPLEGDGTVYYYVLHDGGTRNYSGILTIE